MGWLQVYKAYKDEVQEVAVKIFKPEEGGAQAVESNKFQMEIAIMKGASQTLVLLACLLPELSASWACSLPLFVMPSTTTEYWPVACPSLSRQSLHAHAGVLGTQVTCQALLTSLRACRLPRPQHRAVLRRLH